jgi:hypothetical protein
MSEQSKRGGARKGAGRPPKNETRTAKNLSLLESTIEKIEAEAKRQSISLAAVVDGWAKNCAAQNQK